MIICLTSANDIRTDKDTARLDSYLSKISTGDSLALADLYDCTSASVYAFALSILKNTQDAEDVLHDCYLQIYSAASGYCSCGKPMAWILTITRNLCLLKLRDRQKFSYIPQEDREPYLEACGQMSPEDKLVLAECMNRLSETERQIVILHAVAGFRHREISGILNMPLATVLSKYNRAIKKLKKYIGKEI